MSPTKAEFLLSTADDAYYSRFVFATFVFYACYEIFLTLVWDPVLDWQEAEWENMSEKEKQEIIEAEEEDPPMIFLPFPFTTKAVPQPPYKGSDPEWATFVAINKDRKLQDEIRRTLPVCLIVVDYH